MRSTTKVLGAVAAVVAAHFVALDPAAVDAQAPGRASSLVGLTAPSRLAAVAAEQSGTIAAMPVNEGDRVVTGQILFQLSRRLQELEVARLETLVKSDLERQAAHTKSLYAAEKLARLRQLSEGDDTSRSALAEVELEAQLAQVSLGVAALKSEELNNELLQAQERLAQRVLRSPIDGIVTRRFKQPGETADQLDPVVEVMSVDPLWIEFECPVAAERHYRRGGRVQVQPTVGDHAPRRADIIYVSWKATPSSHTFLVRASMPNADYSWRSGLKVRVDVDAESEAAEAEPAPAPTGK